MRNTNHVILDFEKPQKLNSSSYWAVNFIKQNNTLPLLSNLHLTPKYLKSTTSLKSNHSTNLFLQNRKFTILTDLPGALNAYVDTDLFKPVDPEHRKDVKKYYLTYSRSLGRENFLVKNMGLKNFYIDNLKKTLILSHSVSTGSVTNPLLFLVNANFLRKERLYTKLKYSRTPGYDIVSGGAAVILAGFLGFLVSEKFGIELADSGDFYYLWMYGVFAAFSIRPLLTIASKTQSITSLLSLRHIIIFYNLVINLVLKLVKNFFKK